MRDSGPGAGVSSDLSIFSSLRDFAFQDDGATDALSGFVLFSVFADIDGTERVVTIRAAFAPQAVGTEVPLPGAALLMLTGGGGGWAPCAAPAARLAPVPLGSRALRRVEPRPDEGRQLGLDLAAPLGAVEDAVVASARLHVVDLVGRR